MKRKLLSIMAALVVCLGFSFVQAQTNYLAGWDGNGITGTGSEPTNFGWASSNTSTTWSTSITGAGAVHAYRSDLISGQNVLLRPGSTDVISCKVELEAGVYDFACTATMINRDATSTTFGINTASDATGTVLNFQTQNAARWSSSTNYKFTFKVETSGTYYVTWKTTATDNRTAAWNFSIVENKNIMAGWDAYGNYTDTPHDAGWRSSNASVTNWKTGSESNSYDVNSYQYRDNLGVGRAFIRPYNTTAVFSYPLSLQEGKAYAFSCSAAKMSGDPATRPMSFSVNTASDGSGIELGLDNTAVAKWGSYTNYSFSFAAQSAETVYLIWKDGAAVSGDTDRSLAFGFTLVETDDETVKVTFDTGDGDPLVAAQYIISGTSIARPTDPAKSGVVFKGWFADAEFTTSFNFTTEITTATTIYAKFVDIKSGLKDLIDDAKTLLNEGTPTEAETTYLQNAIDAAQAVVDSESSTEEEIAQALAALNHAITIYNAGFVTASPANPVDCTNLITNPSFENGFTGWTNSGMQTQNNTSFPLKNGTYYCEKWQASGGLPNSSVSQTITNLPNGYYKLTAAAGFGGSGAFIFANNDQIEFGDNNTYSVVTEVTVGTMTIGVKLVSSTANYVRFDNFQLAYTTTSPIIYDAKQALKAQLDILGTYTNNVPSGLWGEEGNFAKAIASGNAVYNADDATIEAINAAITLVTNANTLATSLAPVYSNIKPLIETCESYSTNSIPNTEEIGTTFAAAISTATADAETATTADAINAVYNTLETARQVYVVNADPTNDITFDYTFKITNANVVNSTGWSSGRTGSGEQFTDAPDNTYLDQYNVSSFDDYQELTNLPNGIYSLTAAVRSSTSADVKLYAVASTELSVAFPNAGSTGNTLDRGWGYKTVADIVVVDGTLRIGYKGNVANSGWAGADVFSLTFFGYDIVAATTALQALVGEVETEGYVAKLKVDDLITDLTDAVTQAEAAITAATKLALVDATTTLSDAIAAAKASIAEYADATLSEITVDGNALTLSADVYEYTYYVAPGTTTVPTVTATKNSDVASEPVITGAAAIPGETTIIVTSGDGSTKTYTINFVVNYMYGWDGNETITTPGAAGWLSPNNITWSALNTGGGRNCYRDGICSGGTRGLIGAADNKYAYQLSGLTTGKVYTFTTKYKWVSNGNAGEEKRWTFGANTAIDGAAETMLNSVSGIEADQTVKSATFSFVYSGEETIYLVWNGNKAAYAIDNLVLVETGDAYSITFNSNEGSEVATQYVMNDGNAVATEPTAPTKTGYIFVGWYTDDTLETAYSFATAVTGNITLYAKWEDDNTVSVKDVEKTRFEILNAPNGVNIISGKAQTLQIVSVTGQLIKTVKTDAGKVFVSLPAGMYIINNTKVLVK